MKHISIYSAIISVLLLITDACAQAPNTWTQKADFGGLGRESAVGFGIGSKGYIGTGECWTGTTWIWQNDFWEYDTTTNAWTQKANVPGIPRISAVGFSIGAKGYLGTGVTNNSCLNDFWEYDPSTNSWTQKANFGGSARSAAVGFNIGGKGYIGTGENASSNLTTDFWEYDPGYNTWTQKANFPGSARWAAVGFSIGAKGYLGTGSLSIYTNSCVKDFWEYDPATNVWTQRANFAGSARWASVGLSIYNKGYIGLGIDPNWGNPNDFWEYDPLTNSWSQKANFINMRVFAVGMTIGYRGYVGMGTCTYYIGYALKDFWEYTPSCPIPNAPTNTTPLINQNICIGNSTSLSASGTGILGWYSAASGGTWLGGGTTFATPILTNNTTYYVQDSSSCGVNTLRTAIPVNVNSFPVPTITGSTNLCVNSGYCNYSTEAGMLNYQWSVSSGGVINYGSGTNQIQVSWICAGIQTVSVTYTSPAGCSPTAPAVLSVTVNPVPGQAGNITGISTICAGDNDVPYSVAPVPNAMSYVWILPLHATISSGAGTNSVTISFDNNATSGNISVYGNNLCGNGPVSPDFPVTVNPIPPAPIITNTGNTLSSNEPEGNQWYFEGMLLAGDTSQSYNAPYNGHYWDVVTVNGCSSDTSNHVLIVLTGIVSDPLASINVYPVPSDGRFNVILNATFKESCTIYVYNTLGIKIFEAPGLKPGNSLHYVIDLGRVPDGIYTMIFENNLNRIVKKIVVSK